MPKRILVAEDGRATRDALAILLKNRGYDVVESADGTDALAKARELLPDAILLDSDLPEMTGYDVFRALKMDPACRRIPIVFMVAGSDADELMTRSVPAAEFLVTKPFTAHDLMQRVATVLEKPVTR
jgi:two-component system phosphate regulon response regulator PhoB